MIAPRPTTLGSRGKVLVIDDEVDIREGLELLLTTEGYTADISSRVYATMVARAELTVRSGRSAIVDAVFARCADRDAIERTATAAEVPFAGIWLDAPESTLVARVLADHLDGVNPAS